jgi:O-methyltransferase
VDLLQRHPIVTDQVTQAELAVVLRECHAALRAAGDVVELGCYSGTTSLFLQRLIAKEAPHKVLHVYDSFEGLPAKGEEDTSPVGEQFVEGELATSRAELEKHFKQAGLRMPVIHKGWFENLQDSDMPEKICFAFLDGDFYSSILSSLRAVQTHMEAGGVIVVDDYQSEALPGARKAVQEWLANNPGTLQVEASLAIIRL